MANTDKVLSHKRLINGLTLVSPVGTWQFSGWQKIDEYTEVDINIYGISFALTAIPTADSTEQYIIEIGVGAIGNESTKIQIPYSMRSDTAVAFYFVNSVSLPEPYYVRAGSTISVRIACSVASRTVNGIKLMYTATQNVGEEEVYPNNHRRVQTANGMSTSMGGVI